MSETDENKKSAAKSRFEDLGPQGTMYIQIDDMPEIDAGESLVLGAPPSAALIGLSQTFKNQKFPLRSSRTTIGSKDGGDNDIVLRDPTVSFVHARIIGQEGQWRVMNLLSTNGTFVNGNKVTDAMITHGDRVRFGGAEFLFHDPAKTGNRARGWMLMVGLAAVALLVVAVAAWYLL